MPQTGIADQDLTDQDLPAEDRTTQDLSELSDFYRKEFTRLTRFLIHQGATWSDAEDHAQEAMKSLAIKWSAVQQPASYVRQAAERIFLRHQTTVRARHTTLDLTDHTNRTDRSDDTDARYETTCSTDVRYVLDLLAGLPPAQREVMAWTIDGYEPAEIAEATGQKAATVRSHLRHARRRLEAALQQRAQTTDGKEDPRWPST